MERPSFQGAIHICRSPTHISSTVQTINCISYVRAQDEHAMYNISIRWLSLQDCLFTYKDVKFSSPHPCEIQFPYIPTWTLMGFNYMSLLRPNTISYLYQPIYYMDIGPYILLQIYEKTFSSTPNLYAIFSTKLPQQFKIRLLLQQG